MLRPMKAPRPRAVILLVGLAAWFGCGAPGAPHVPGDATARSEMEPPACPGAATPAPDERKHASFIVQDGITHTVNTMSMSEDGRLLAAAEVEGLIRVWDTRAGLLLKRFKAPGAGHTLLLSRDGKRLAYSEQQEMEHDPSAVVILDLGDGTARRIKPFGAFGFIGADGSKVAVGRDGAVDILDA